MLQKTQFCSIKNEDIDNIIVKTETLKKEIQEIQSPMFKQNDIDFQSIKQEILTIKKNSQFINSLESKFNEVIKSSLNLIDSIFDIYLKSITLSKLHPNPIEKESFNKNITNDIGISIKSIKFFLQTLKNSMDFSNSSTPTLYKMSKLYYDCLLFKCSTDIQSLTQFPFYRSAFLPLPDIYDSFLSLQACIHNFQTGYHYYHLYALLIMHILKVFKEQLAIPFILLVEPFDSEINMIKEKCASLCSKNVQIEFDESRINQYYTKKSNDNKVIIGVLKPESVLSLMYNQRSNLMFYKKSRILLDSRYPRTTFFDALIEKIGYLNISKGVFKMPLNLSLISGSTVDYSIVSKLGKNIPKSPFLQSAFYEVKTRTLLPGQPGSSLIREDPMKRELHRLFEQISTDQSGLDERNIMILRYELPKHDSFTQYIKKIVMEFKQPVNGSKIILLSKKLNLMNCDDKYLYNIQLEYEMCEKLRIENGDSEYIYYVLLEDIICPEVKDIINTLPKSINYLLIADSDDTSLHSKYGKIKYLFDPETCYYKIFDNKFNMHELVEQKASQQIKDIHKGVLGQSFKAEYIPIPINKRYPEMKASIECSDLLKEILFLRSLQMDFEKIRNFPTMPNKKNVDFALNTLKRIKAIDQNAKITQLGYEILKYPFDSILHSASLIEYQRLYQKTANHIDTLIAGFAILIIENPNMLKTVCLLGDYFDESSDIITIMKPLIEIFKNNNVISKADEKDAIEKIGMRYDLYLILKDKLQQLITIILPNISLQNVMMQIESFQTENPIKTVINNLILCFFSTIPQWKKTHHITYDHILAKKDDPLLLIYNMESDPFNKNSFPIGTVALRDRPGLRGYNFPCNSICFDLESYHINQDIGQNTQYYGRIIHRLENSITNAQSISSVKVEDNSSLIMFLSIYVDGLEPLFLIDENNNESQSSIYFDFSKDVEMLFYCSDSQKRQFVIDAIEKCMKIAQYEPRSVLMQYDNQEEIVVEILSVNSRYKTRISDNAMGVMINKSNLDFCLEHLEELASPNSKIRIGVSCPNPFSLNVAFNYYLICDDYDEMIGDLSPLNHLLSEQKYNLYPYGQVIDFTFPYDFLDPSLMENKSTSQKIRQWFTKCDYAKMISIDQNSIIMESRYVKNLEKHIKEDRNEILAQLDLDYTTVDIPVCIQKHSSLIQFVIPSASADENRTCIICPKEDVDKIQNCIGTFKTAKIEYKLKVKGSKAEKKFCCYEVCEDQNYPETTIEPFYAYNKSGGITKRKICLECLKSFLQNETNGFIKNGQIDQDALDNICHRPKPIAFFNEYAYNDETRPNIPFGYLFNQLIYYKAISKYFIPWLKMIAESAIRTDKKHYTFCPDHPHQVFRIDKKEEYPFVPSLKCICPDCRNCLCEVCLCWHPPDFQCEERKHWQFKWSKRCPFCTAPVEKSAGCNHIECKCGHHWCYKCLAGFETSDECYAHMRKIHQSIQ